MLKKSLKKVKAAKSKAGHARAAALSPQARSLIAAKAAQARWAKAAQDTRALADDLASVELARTDAPDYIVHKTQKPTETTFQECIGKFDDRTYRMTQDIQWTKFNEPFIANTPLIVIGSMLRHPMLTRVAYELFSKGVAECVKIGKISRWTNLDYSNAWKKEKKPNLGLLLLDNAHVDMDSKKYSLLQDYIYDESLTRIVVVHGADPFQFAFDVIRHKPDLVFNVSVREKALKSIII